jgi:hypothetical protein
VAAVWGSYSLASPILSKTQLNRAGKEQLNPVGIFEDPGVDMRIKPTLIVGQVAEEGAVNGATGIKHTIQ